MARTVQTVCLGGSRKKRCEKKGDFHWLTFFAAPTLTLGDKKCEVVTKIVVDGFVIILLAAELKKAKHRIEIFTDLNLDECSRYRAYEHTRLSVKPTAQVLSFVVKHCRAFLKCPPCVIDTHFFYSRVGIVPHSFISVQNSCHVA
jgi:hypothetical protein